MGNDNSRERTKERTGEDTPPGRRGDSTFSPVTGSPVTGSPSDSTFSPVSPEPVLCRSNDVTIMLEGKDVVIKGDRICRWIRGMEE